MDYNHMYDVAQPRLGFERVKRALCWSDGKTAEIRGFGSVQHLLEKKTPAMVVSLGFL